MLRRGLTFIGGHFSITPYMVSASAFVEFKTSHGEIILSNQEFEYLQSGVDRVRDQYHFLDMLKIEYCSIEEDSPYPSHLYAQEVLELGPTTYFFTCHHNNSLTPYICLVKDGLTICLDKEIFSFAFPIVSDAMDVLAKNFALNWCWYCNKHISTRNRFCVVCEQRPDILSVTHSHNA